GLGPTQRQWKNFSPVLGLAWAPSRDGKTVVRAGGGIFYDFLFPANLDGERALLGPTGLGRQTFSGSSIPNTLPDIPDVPVGTPLHFPNTPTRFTGANLLSILPSIRASLLESLHNSDPSVSRIQVIKQSGLGPGVAGGLFPSKYPRWSAQHAHIGVQREIVRDFVVSADFVYRHFVHVGIGSPDMNHFNSARGPVI